jgi:hypothetical protein
VMKPRSENDAIERLRTLTEATRGKPEFYNPLTD